eukprot:TRINITY_DN66502_c6_g7_i1.p1 TRINITY_DN66502_c6_g7~~TRINITY_DN66502_c6_g7_i1.p1  ORF type:complete len:371 (-),score=8.27 TRINITY_DN66502_c6_g7_i1:29-1141(-)
MDLAAPDLAQFYFLDPDSGDRRRKETRVSSYDEDFSAEDSCKKKPYLRHAPRWDRQGPANEDTKQKWRFRNRICTPEGLHPTLTREPLVHRATLHSFVTQTLHTPLCTTVDPFKDNFGTFEDEFFECFHDDWTCGGAVVLHSFDPVGVSCDVQRAFMKTWRDMCHNENSATSVVYPRIGYYTLYPGDADEIAAIQSHSISPKSVCKGLYFLTETSLARRSIDALTGNQGNIIACAVLDRRYQGEVMHRAEAQEGALHSATVDVIPPSRYNPWTVGHEFTDDGTLITLGKCHARDLCPMFVLHCSALQDTRKITNHQSVATPQLVAAALHQSDEGKVLYAHQHKLLRRLDGKKRDAQIRAQRRAKHQHPFF